MKITKDNLTLGNVLSVKRAYSNIIKERFGLKEYKEHEKIQMVLRATLCRECISKGACVICNCKTPDLMEDFKRIDSAKRWGSLMNENTWNNFIESIPQDVALNIDTLAQYYTAYYRENGLALNKEPHVTVHKGSGTITHTLQVPDFVKTKDFGTVMQGDNVSHEFSFENTSSFDLNLENISSSCGCTIPSFKKGVVKPGEFFRFSAKYDSNRIGEFKRHLTPRITIADPESKVRLIVPQFVIQGTVKKKD